MTLRVGKSRIQSSRTPERHREFVEYVRDKKAVGTPLDGDDRSTLLMKQRAKANPDAGIKVFASQTGGTYDFGTPFKDAVKAAGKTDFRFDDLSHAAAITLPREGASEQQLKAISGWKAGIASRYGHIARNDARAVMEKMNKKLVGREQR